MYLPAEPPITGPDFSYNETLGTRDLGKQKSWHVDKLSKYTVIVIISKSFLKQRNTQASTKYFKVFYTERLFASSARRHAARPPFQATWAPQPHRCRKDRFIFNRLCRGRGWVGHRLPLRGVSFLTLCVKMTAHLPTLLGENIHSEESRYRERTAPRMCTNWTHVWAPPRSDRGCL